MRVTPNSGGVQRVTETLAKEFMNLGFDVCYLSFSNGTDELINGVEQFYLPNNGILDATENSQYVKEIIQSKQIDCIINQMGFFLEQLLFIKKNIPKSTKIFTVHHNCLECLNKEYKNIYLNTLEKRKLNYFLNNKLGWFLLKRIHKHRFAKMIEDTIEISDKLILLSEKFIDEVKFYTRNFDTSKLSSIPNPNPFGVNKVNLEGKKDNLLYVGRLDYGQKRADLIIDIWERLYDRYPNWSFNVIGDGPLREELILRSQRLERISFHGKTNPEKFYKEAKIFCLTSTFEGFGMVLVEAQSYGVVPVAFNCFSSIHEVVDHERSGIIVKDRRMNEFIDEVVRLIEDSERQEEMSKYGIDFVKKYEAESIALQWKNLLMECCDSEV